MLATGKRWAESSDRARLPPWEWRGEIGPSSRFPEGWKALWIRPVLDLRYSEVVRRVIAAGLAPHPGYFAQGETLESMRNEWRDERGRARLSCVCCIFTRGAHLRNAKTIAPDSAQPAIDAVRAFEARTGKTWRQGESLDDLIAEASIALPLFDGK